MPSVSLPPTRNPLRFFRSLRCSDPPPPSRGRTLARQPAQHTAEMGRNAEKPGDLGLRRRAQRDVPFARRRRPDLVRRSVSRDLPTGARRLGGRQPGRPANDETSAWRGVTRRDGGFRGSRAPAGAQRFLVRFSRWFRCASPPANFLRASGTKRRRAEDRGMFFATSGQPETGWDHAAHRRPSPRFWRPALTGAKCPNSKGRQGCLPHSPGRARRRLFPPQPSSRLLLLARN